MNPHLLISACILIITICAPAVHSFQYSHPQLLPARSIASPLYQSSDDEVPNVDSDDDWRAFRARLVMGAKTTGESSTSSSSLNTDREQESAATATKWAYNSGYFIEPGSIILAKAEPDFCYFGLNQQYFHKAVMMVTHHEENGFTKGIILNRPTNLCLDDDDFLDEDGNPFISEENERNDDENNEWRIWYGGDVHGLYSDDPEIVCLHSINTEVARDVSQEIMKDVMLTNYHGARKIIDAREAKSSDFWAFAGSAGWSAGQLLDELRRESWYMVSTDSDTVWSELVRQRDDDDADPRDAGLKTWSMLMGMIGKADEAQQLSESFADLTLKEWAAETILFNSSAVNEVAPAQEGSDGLGALTQLEDFGLIDSVDKLVKLALDAKEGKIIGAGSILRGSTADRSPFLLSDQKFHKSTLLVLQDDDVDTVAVMLNHPTTKHHPLTLPNGEEVQINVRYGGSYGIPFVSDQPVIFLHAKQVLKDRHCGEPVGNSDESHIWICSDGQVIDAISNNFAQPKDFMCIQGFTIWDKNEDSLEDGILADVLSGGFEVVSSIHAEKIWSTLLMQDKLSLETIDRNCRISMDAWSIEGKKDGLSSRCVYGSTVNVAELSDDALRYWIEAALLGKIVSVRKYSAFE